MKKIEIECNRKVRDYVCCQIKSLTGLSVGEAYELMKKDGCLPVTESANILKQKDGRNIFKECLISK